MHAQRLRVLDPLGPPHLLEDHPLRHHEAGVACEEGEDVELGRRQGDLLARPADAAAGDVDLEVAGRDDRRRRRERRRPPQQRADAGEQLAGGERLGEVVVGALVQRRDLVGLVGAHRQDQDRRGHPRAQLAADLDAGAVGEHEVEHHEVRGRVDGLDERLVAGRGHVQGVAARGEDGLERAADLLLVVDDEDVRRVAPAPSCALLLLRPRRLAARGQRDHEPRAVRRDVVDADRAAVAAHDLPGDRQAEAGARGRVLPGAPAAEELLEHRFVFVGRDALSLVLDPQAHALVPAAGADRHRRRPRRAARSQGGSGGPG